MACGHPLIFIYGLNRSKFTNFTPYLNSEDPCPSPHSLFFLQQNSHTHTITNPFLKHSNMGEADDEREPFFSTLKFPLLPPPAADHYPSGTATPPLQTSASVPFKWEELPGKPRPCTDIILRPDPAKCLELPPCRMIFMEPAITKMPSPTTVIDGPYSSFRLFRESRASFDSSSSGGGSPKKKTTRFFSMKINGKKEVTDGGIFGFSTEGKVRRNGSFSSLSKAASAHLWVTMRESIKKAMPWKSRRKSTKEEACLNK